MLIILSLHINETIVADFIHEVTHQILDKVPQLIARERASISCETPIRLIQIDIIPLS